MTSVFGMLIWNGSCDIPSNVIIQRINFYDIKIQLMMVGIDNQYVYYLFGVIYIHKKYIYYVIILYIIKDIGK